MAAYATRPGRQPPPGAIQGIDPGKNAAMAPVKSTRNTSGGVLPPAVKKAAAPPAKRPPAPGRGVEAHHRDQKNRVTAQVKSTRRIITAGAGKRGPYDDMY